MVIRPPKRQTFLRMARELAEQSTCMRRKVGVIMTDNHWHIVAHGYNGVAASVTHCIDHPCQGAHMHSGQGLDMCEAIHAEQNALIKCHDVSKILNVYCTTAPCVHCTKMLMNTGAQRIFFVEDYPNSDYAMRLWTGSSEHRTWHQVDL